VAEIDVMDRVRITKVKDTDKHLLNRVGIVLMITDGENCVVRFPDGASASVTADQLVRLR
jgi:hypothetical protein